MGAMAIGQRQREDAQIFIPLAPFLLNLYELAVFLKQATVLSGSPLSLDLGNTLPLLFALSGQRGPKASFVTSSRVHALTMQLLSGIFITLSSCYPN